MLTPPASERGTRLEFASAAGGHRCKSGTHYYGLVVANQALGRNDSIATATALTGPFAYVSASLSPFSDPPGSSTSAPDTDYYSLSATAGQKVTIRVPSSSIVDPVIEILDANGQRYKTCREVGDDNPTLTYIVKDPTPTAFDDECLNDDIDPGVNRSAYLEFLVPGAAGSQLKFYIHVFDALGNARPDMAYTMNLSTTGP